MTKYVAAIIIIYICIYELLIQPWIMRMGTTKSERSMQLPGDGLVVRPNEYYTQANIFG